MSSNEDKIVEKEKKTGDFRWLKFSAILQRERNIMASLQIKHVSRD